MRKAGFSIVCLVIGFLLLTVFFVWHFGVRIPLRQRRERNAAAREADAASD